MSFFALALFDDKSSTLINRETKKELKKAIKEWEIDAIEIIELKIKQMNFEDKTEAKLLKTLNEEFFEIKR